MNKRAYKTYTKEFKLEAIRLADESDKSVAQVARELGLRVNQIYKWKEQLGMKQENVFPGKGRVAAKDKDAEIRRLKKALAADGYGVGWQRADFLSRLHIEIRYFLQHFQFGTQRS